MNQMRTSAGVSLLLVVFIGCGTPVSMPSTHKYEPFGKYVLEIEAVGSTGFKTSLVNRQSGDEVTQQAEYQWGPAPRNRSM